MMNVLLLIVSYCVVGSGVSDCVVYRLSVSSMVIMILNCRLRCR